jgi:hypothetical protein
MAERWQRHGNTAQIASAIIAGILMIIAFYGFSTANLQLKQIRENSAERLFGDYLRLAAEKPGLSEPDYMALKNNKTTFAAYKAFVWNLLYGCEEILNSFGPDKAWERTCRDHVARHVRYLCEFEMKQLDAYSLSMQRFIESIVNDRKPSDDAPECKR